MARKETTKALEIFADGSASNSGLLFRAGIAIVREGKLSGEKDFFRINPSTIEDSKPSNWASQTVPGQNNPVLQWISGGARVLSFEALVTEDLGDGYVTPKGFFSNLLDTSLNAVGSVAGAFFGVNLPPLSALGDLFGSDVGDNNLSIARKLSFYKDLLEPSYDPATGKLVGSPPTVVLYFGSSLASSKDFSNAGVFIPIPTTINTMITATTLLWVLTELRTKVTKFLPDLTPIEAVVNFTFTQYMISPVSSSSTPSLSINQAFDV